MRKKPPAPDTSSKLILLDKVMWWDKPATLLVHWTEVDVPTGHYSIPLMVENKAADLRKEYLTWIHNLGECRINGLTLREHLRLDNENSFWWMTLLAEKSPLKSPSIYTVLKLRALEKLYLPSGCDGIVLCSGNQTLHRVISSWCRRIGHSYQWHRFQRAKPPLGLGELFRMLPFPVQAVGWLLRSILLGRRYVGAVKKIPGDDRQATLVTYFPNIDNKMAQKGIFRSKYWEKLHDVLNQGSCVVNWIFLFSPQRQKLNFKRALELRHRFEQNAEGRARFFFLEEFMTVRVIFQALMIYLGLICKWFRLRTARSSFRFPASSLRFWEILAPDWHSSLCGYEAMKSCLMLSVFQSMVRIMPRQEWGLYLWENQSWEKALIYSWKKEQPGKLIGYQHSTLRFLNTRNFEDSRSYLLESYPPPLPDVLAVNGKWSEVLLKEAGFPDTRIRPVEAVRYLYLNQNQGRGFSEIGLGAGNRTLLVVTGILPSETQALLRLLNQVAEKGGLKDYPNILIKSHPAYPIASFLKDVMPNLSASIVKEPLSMLWEKATVVYTGNSTSAALEAAMLGVPLLINMDSKNLNLSPFFGIPGSVFVATRDDLVKSLQAPRKIPVPPEYFYLDDSLYRWRKLFREIGASPLTFSSTRH